MTRSHTDHMRAALALAARNLGKTWPNPAVGALVVKNNQVIGRGYTARGGRPHAETQALDEAGHDAQGATLYVTLEPCAHHGKTPPCTQAIIEAGIARVVIACRDPNPPVNGQGIEQLNAAGIAVEEGVCKAEALALNAGFISVVEKKRPFISLKLATSLDGKIATSKGDSKWITGQQARDYGHLLRSRYDAIATGSATVLADDPAMTCRLPGLTDRSPVRVVFDRSGRVPKEAKILTQQEIAPTWLLWEENIEDALATLTEKGITRLLVEAGMTLSTAFIRSGLVDRLYWFKSPIIIGDDGLSAMGRGFSPTLAGLARMKHLEHIQLGNDSLDIFSCSPAS